jgi:hypothetical protein
MIRVTREELIFDIAYAIGSNLRLLPNKREHLGADSDEVAQGFRFDGAQNSDLKAPSLRSLAGR